MGKKLMLAVAFVALVAAPAFASVQNVKVGGDLKTTSVIRNNFTTAGINLGDDSQNLILSQVGLNVQADLTDNVSAVIRLTNERVWGEYNGSNDDDPIDSNTANANLDTAYVTMKELLYSPLTVTVGRQPLAYGSQLLVGDGDSTTQASATAQVGDLTGGVNFDAIKAVFGYDTFTVDVFAAKVSEDEVLGLNDKDDVNLYGVNAAFKLGDKMGSVVEAYTFVRMDKSAIDDVAADTKTKKLYVPGLRVSTNPIEGLALSLEGAYQRGNGAADKTISAYGLQGMANFALPVVKDMKPMLSLGYTYLSGDKNTSDNKIKSFDSLYENQNGGRIFDALSLANSNVKMAQVALEVAPIQDVTTKLSWYNLSRIKKTGLGNKVGNELDLDVTYAYTEDVKFGVSAGIFYPNNAYDQNTQKELTQVLSSVSVLF